MEREGGEMERMWEGEGDEELGKGERVWEGER